MWPSQEPPTPPSPSQPHSSHPEWGSHRWGQTRPQVPCLSCPPPNQGLSPPAPHLEQTKACLCGGLGSPLGANLRHSGVSPPPLSARSRGAPDPPQIPAACRPRAGQWVIIISLLLPNPPLSPIHKKHLLPRAGRRVGGLPPTPPPPPSPARGEGCCQGTEHTVGTGLLAALGGGEAGASPGQDG